MGQARVGNRWEYAMVDLTNPINWSIKLIAEEAKDHAFAQAKAAGVPVGIWLEKLLLAHRDGTAGPSARTSQVDLRALAEVLRAAADIMQTSGAPIPKRAISNAYSLLAHELRHRRKELPQQPRQRQVGSDHSSGLSLDGTAANFGVSNAVPGLPRIANNAGARKKI